MIATTPKRIISLVPSQTELLFDLGLDKEVVGITKFCVHPQEWFKIKTRVGGTKTVDIEKVIALKPDLIIANKEENVREQVEALEELAPVYLSDISTLEDSIEMIRQIGLLTNTAIKATSLIAQIQKDFKELTTSLKNNSNVNVAYLIWQNPYITIGGDTFINDMLQHCGFTNVFAEKKRYPEVSINELAAAGCSMVFLSSEPYPFKQKHADELQKQLPGMKIALVDGEMFSWYGSRLLKAVNYFRQLTIDLHTNENA